MYIKTFRFRSYMLAGCCVFHRLSTARWQTDIYTYINSKWSELRTFWLSMLATKLTLNDQQNLLLPTRLRLIVSTRHLRGGFSDWCVGVCWWRAAFVDVFDHLWEITLYGGHGGDDGRCAEAVCEEREVCEMALESRVECRSWTHRTAWRSV